MDTPIPRATCYTCFKPEAFCICGDLPRVSNQTRIIVLQHPRERHHPLGTVRLARLALEKLEVRECAPRDVASFQRATQFAPRTTLLYPGPQAVPLGQVTPPPETLVVLDGTWHHAKTLYRESVALRALPQVGITPPMPSQYLSLRREPRAECVSTLEAIIWALTALEPETQGLPELLAAFQRMVQKQQAHTKAMRSPRQKSAKRFALRRGHRETLLQRMHRARDNLVIGYAELACHPEEPCRRELVTFSAVRPATGEVFCRAVQPSFALNARHLHHMQLPAWMFERGLASPGAADASPAVLQDITELREHWQRFAGAEDVLMVWNRSSMGYVNTGEPTVVLKEVYCNLTHRRCGHLDDVMRAEKLIPNPVDVPGRAAQRLGNAWALFEHLVLTEHRQPETGAPFSREHVL